VGTLKTFSLVSDLYWVQGINVGVIVCRQRAIVGEIRSKISAGSTEGGKTEFAEVLEMDGKRYRASQEEYGKDCEVGEVESENGLAGDT